MKHLHQVLSRGRATLRRLRTVAPGAARSQRPVRLVLRVGAEGDDGGLSLEDWQHLIVEAVDWLGPTRVCLRCDASSSSLLVPLVRFANRLECPTHMIGAGPVDAALAGALVDAGLAAATLRLGALDEAQHLARTGVPQAETLGAFDQLRQVRDDRGRPLALLAALCLAPDTLVALGAMAGLARQVGADDVLVSLPADSPVPPGAAEAVAGLDPHCTSSALVAALSGGRSRTPLGLRLEVGPDGSLSAAHGGGGLGVWSRDALKDLWEAADTAVGAALDADRPADEIELVPRVLYSSR